MRHTLSFLGPLAPIAMFLVFPPPTLGPVAMAVFMPPLPLRLHLISIPIAAHIPDLPHAN